MKKSVLNILFVASLAVGLSACNSMTTQQRNTAAGAVIGGAAGSRIGGAIMVSVLALFFLLRYQNT